VDLPRFQGIHPDIRAGGQRRKPGRPCPIKLISI
jgi:hypothetical protein